MTKPHSPMILGTKPISSPSRIVRSETRFSPAPSSTAASSYEFCSGYAIHSLPNKSAGFEPMFSFFDLTPAQTPDRTGARSFFVTIRSFSRLAFRLPT
jgi:hypothetical protein